LIFIVVVNLLGITKHMRGYRSQQQDCQGLPSLANWKSASKLSQSGRRTEEEPVLQKVPQTQQQQLQQQQHYTPSFNATNMISISHRSSYLMNSQDNPSTIPPSSPFAYVFLLGGVMSERTNVTDYRGGLFSVLVAAHNLRRHGSTADVVLLVQMSAWGNHTQLPKSEQELCHAMNVRIVYIPKFSHPKLETFYGLMVCCSCFVFCLLSFRMLWPLHFFRIIRKTNSWKSLGFWSSTNTKECCIWTLTYSQNATSIT
jgi:hypothetical protein